MRKKVYCPKCDLYYWTPRGRQEMSDCPFCSLGEVADDNLEVADKKRILRRHFCSVDSKLKDNRLCGY